MFRQLYRLSDKRLRRTGPAPRPWHCGRVRGGEVIQPGPDHLHGLGGTGEDRDGHPRVLASLRLCGLGSAAVAVPGGSPVPGPGACPGGDISQTAVRFCSPATTFHGHHADQPARDNPPDQLPAGIGVLSERHGPAGFAWTRSDAAGSRWSAGCAVGDAGDVGRPLLAGEPLACVGADIRPGRRRAGVPQVHGAVVAGGGQGPAGR